MFVIEEQVNGAWTVCRTPGTEDNANKTVAAMRLCDPSRTLRVSEFGRVEPTLWRIFYCQPGHWSTWMEFRTLGTETEARREIERSRVVYPTTRFRLVRCAEATVETFEPKGGA